MSDVDNRRGGQRAGHERDIDTSELLSVLASDDRRLVLRYLMTRDATTVPFDELVEWVTDHRSGDREVTAVTLHHTHLPALAEKGLLEYDDEGRTVRFYGHPEARRLLECIDRWL